jgi:hypothetical protein
VSWMVEASVGEVGGLFMGAVKDRDFAMVSAVSVVGIMVGEGARPSTEEG